MYLDIVNKLSHGKKEIKIYFFKNVEERLEDEKEKNRKI